MIEIAILAHLLEDEQYARKVLPFLRAEYFEDAGARQNKVLFEIIADYASRYGRVPTREAIDVELSQRTGFSDDTAQATHDLAHVLRTDPATSKEWLLSKTEEFCQRKSAYRTLLKGLEYTSGDGSRMPPVAQIHDMWREALSINFDPDLGHNYLKDAAKRFEAYKKQERRVPFDLSILNKITRGGLPGKSLSCILASTGVGKSMIMGHMAASHLMMGKNVVYFTLEMSAMEQIGERIDSNLMGTDVRQVAHLSREVFDAKIEAMSRKTLGELIIKEYPTGSAGTHHFRNFISELRLKSDFRPDIVFVDYINLCVSSRIRAGSDANTYTIIKYIAQELRGLAMELDIPVVTATQTNRSGYKNTDPDMENTADSIGLPMEVDFMIALVSTEELEQKGQLLFKQLKNRWCGTSEYNKFLLGIDRSRMRLYELDAALSPLGNAPAPRPRASLDFTGFS